MATKMGPLPIKKVMFNSKVANDDGEYEFIIDCESVYFDVGYDNEGNLQFVDQYFYTERHSHGDINYALEQEDLLSVDDTDFPVKSYLLAKQENGNEWLRFHAVVPKTVDPGYFHQKYIGE
ncbi:hypothetical protein [Pelosinus sp. IPA-1]|uniref:hypothetical protein n=1 Tax=Pelosinus sp. IPA-1 TaxID=3029569 RepID=UPI0024361920|nr:hypothetical protein [Pelosinus sp. IPA-1]GMB00318.1 hypothetical protein PIPA1_31170 [Pelosinus sp. IPA-1]